MFKNILYMFSLQTFLMKTFLNAHKITQKARFHWKCFLNIYKIAEEWRLWWECFSNNFGVNDRFKSSSGFNGVIVLLGMGVL